MDQIFLYKETQVKNVAQQKLKNYTGSLNLRSNLFVFRLLYHNTIVKTIPTTLYNNFPMAMFSKDQPTQWNIPGTVPGKIQQNFHFHRPTA
jgi:hypothetical protein